MATQIIPVTKATWTLLSIVPCVFANKAQHVFYTVESDSLPTESTFPVSQLTAKSGRDVYQYKGGSGDLYAYSPDHTTDFQIDESTTPIPGIVAIGSVEGAWEDAGDMTVVNTSSFTTFVESDMLTATAGSFLEFDISPSPLLKTFRPRLGAISETAVIDIYRSKEEPGSNERFYDRIATLTIVTSASAIAAEGGGFYADGTTAIVAADDVSLKGFNFEGNNARVAVVDLLTHDKIIAVCTTMPASNIVAIDHSIA
ncbi:hypothetical protein KAR91_18765 [Candidatus Pacearchaeota archaeon]|nr:hypothetical protein [Candidatus Pacearchaeota archaeon]